MQLAELNVGRLRGNTDDPIVAEFMENLDRINGLGKRMPGFVWMMEGAAGAGHTEAKIDGDPRYVPNLTVWETAAQLETFVFKTLHAKFMERRRSGSKSWKRCTLSCGGCLTGIGPLWRKPWKNSRNYKAMGKGRRPSAGTIYAPIRSRLRNSAKNAQINDLLLNNTGFGPT